MYRKRTVKALLTDHKFLAISEISNWYPICAIWQAPIPKETSMLKNYWNGLD